jgi:hypothetical protein
MPRISRGKMKSETLTNGLIASARTIRVREGLPPKKIKKSEWQNEGWDFYDLVEVYHYAVQWVGNTLSRAKLVVYKDGKVCTEEAVIEVMDAFYGGRDQHGEFLRQAAIHMTVAGEGYLIGYEDDDDEEWLVGAATEFKSDSTGYKFNGDYLPDAAFVMRFWRPHPRKPNQSDSPTRPLLPTLSQLVEATKYVSAQLDSRLTGAGLVLLPQEITFPTPITDKEGNQSQEAGLNGIMQELAEVGALAKADPSSPSARVPNFLAVPGEHVGNVKHLTFWTELDEAAPALRTELIRRIALGLDMPADALAPDPNAGSGNHWSDWQTADSVIKSHAEPLLELLTRAVTSEYLRVTLIEQSIVTEDDAHRYTIVPDTAEMRLRPDRSQVALEMWDRGELNAIALRREVGFDEADAMSPDEQKLWLLRKLAQGSPSPELVQAAVDALGIEIKVPDDYEPGGERPLPRSLEEHPKEDIPERPEADAAALLAIGESAIMRALERGGNRIMSSGTKIDGIPKGLPATDRYRYVHLNKSQLDMVLTDAWSGLDRLTLPSSINRDRLEQHLDNYARMLITSRAAYDRNMLSTYLDLVWDK